MLQFNQAMARSDALAIEIDTRLRARRGQYDEATVSQSLARLKTCCQESLQEHKQLIERFHARIGEMGDLQTLAQEIETANAELVIQIQATLDNLEKLNLQPDLLAAAERLLEDIDQLRGTWHRLRDEHETAYVALARQEDRLTTIDSQLQQDPLAGLANRIGLETTLARWWADDWPKTRPVSLVALDLDHFATLNAEQGADVCDRILIQIGQWVAEMAGRNSIVARIGQRFVAAVAGVDLGALTAKVESLRQAIARTTFAREEQTMALTATAALAAPAETDTPVSILEKLDRTLATAREAGRNRSFVDDEQGVKAITPSEEFPPLRTVLV
jgi:diguanylate cyclase (GGDEF)-like protein